LGPYYKGRHCCLPAGAVPLGTYVKRMLFFWQNSANSRIRTFANSLLLDKMWRGIGHHTRPLPKSKRQPLQYPRCGNNKGFRMNNRIRGRSRGVRGHEDQVVDVRVVRDGTVLRQIASSWSKVRPTPSCRPCMTFTIRNYSGQWSPHFKHTGDPQDLSPQR
jgi:hypothetical protein